MRPEDALVLRVDFDTGIHQLCHDQWVSDHLDIAPTRDLDDGETPDLPTDPSI